jgi:hypothetical protein
VGVRVWKLILDYSFYSGHKVKVINDLFHPQNFTSLVSSLSLPLIVLCHTLLLLVWMHLQFSYSLFFFTILSHFFLLAYTYHHSPFLMSTSPLHSYLATAPHLYVIPPPHLLSLILPYLTLSSPSPFLFLISNMFPLTFPHWQNISVKNKWWLFCCN